MGVKDMLKGNDGAKAPKATDLLKEDHDKVRSLFKEFRALEDGEDGEKRRICEEVRKDLTIHSKLEEEIFYPAVKKVPDDDAGRIVAEATEEHAIVKRLVEELGSFEAVDEVFAAKMKVLMEAVEHHAEEEEDDMFSEAKRGMDDHALRALGARIEARKSELLSGGVEAERSRSPLAASTAPKRKTGGSTRPAR